MRDGTARPALGVLARDFASVHGVVSRVGAAFNRQPKAVSVKYIVCSHRYAPRPVDLSPRPSLLKERGSTAGSRAIADFSVRATGGTGGFSVLIRSAPMFWCTSGSRRPPSCIRPSEGIHGKTGPLPKGAVLFGPFSYAHKKKDVRNRKIRIYQKRTDLQMTNPFLPFRSKSCIRRVP